MSKNIDEEERGVRRWHPADGRNVIGGVGEYIRLVISMPHTTVGDRYIPGEDDQ